MPRITERRLGKTFKETISESSLPSVHSRIRFAVPELDSWEGIADFVVTPDRADLLPPRVSNGIKKAITTTSTALVVSQLKRGRSRKSEDIVHLSGLNISTVRKVMNSLAEYGIVEELPGRRYVLSSRYAKFLPDPGIELWACELKVRDWGHAFYQALRYRAFAHRTWIVVPEDVAQRLEPRRKEFRAFNVGLMAVNVKEKSVKVIVLPRAEKPTSQPHYLFAIATFLRRMNGGRKVVARRP